jgi:alginate O-acetyltransferase complex protein AlgJ
MSQPPKVPHGSSPAVAVVGSDVDPRPHEHHGAQPVADPPGRLHSGRRMNRKVVVLPLVCALVFFLGPAAAFILGNRATEIDNRALTRMPSLSQGWNFIPQFQSWANDYLPLRAQAVAVGTNLSEWLFREPPNYTGSGGSDAGVPGGAVPVVPGQASGTTSAAAGAVNYPKVIPGKDGWLYFGGDVASVCPPTEAMTQVIPTVQQLAAAVQASGRKFVLVIATDKSTAHPENLPDTFAGKQCMQDQKKALSQRLATIKGVTLVDVRAPLAAAEKQFGFNAYRPQDTHWGPLGAMVMGRQLAGALSPNLLQDTTATVRGTVSLRGDLSVLLGTAKYDTQPNVVLDRPGVQLSIAGQPVTPAKLPTVGYAFQTVTATSTKAPLFPGRTLLYGDSFLASSLPYVVPYFSSLQYINYNAGALPGVAGTLATHTAAADTVVVEMVERNAAGGGSALLLPSNLEAIYAALKADPK